MDLTDRQREILRWIDEAGGETRRVNQSAYWNIVPGFRQTNHVSVRALIKLGALEVVETDKTGRPKVCKLTDAGREAGKKKR